MHLNPNVPICLSSAASRGELFGMGNLAVLRPISLVQSIRNKYNSQSAAQSTANNAGFNDGSGGGGAAGGGGGRQRVELKSERIARKQASLDAFKVSDAQGLIEQVTSLSYLYICTLASFLSYCSDNDVCYSYHATGFAAVGGG